MTLGPSYSDKSTTPSFASCNQKINFEVTPQKPKFMRPWEDNVKSEDTANHTECMSSTPVRTPYRSQPIANIDNHRISTGYSTPVCTPHRPRVHSRYSPYPVAA